MASTIAVLPDPTGPPTPMRVTFFFSVLQSPLLPMDVREQCMRMQAMSIRGKCEPSGGSA